MNDVGRFWDTVTGHPDVFRPEFCNKVMPLTKEVFESICEIDFSVQGSSSRQSENETIYSWELFLQDIDGNYSAAQLA